MLFTGNYFYGGAWQNRRQRLRFHFCHSADYGRHGHNDLRRPQNHAVTAPYQTDIDKNIFFIAVKRAGNKSRFILSTETLYVPSLIP